MVCSKTWSRWLLAWRRAVCVRRPGLRVPRVPFVPFVLAGLVVAPSGATAQPIGLTLGDSLRVTVAPNGRLTVPLHLDLSESPGTALAALQGTVTWSPTRLRLDSVRAIPGGPLALSTNTSTATGGLVSLIWFGAAGATSSGPIARLYFTGRTTGGGTLVSFTPTSAGDAAGGALLARLAPVGQQVCVAGSTWSTVTPRWGDVTNDGVVNVVDAQQLARHLIGLSVPNAPKVLERGDVTADGVVNVVDAQQIARAAAALPAAARINQIKSEPGEVASVASLAVTPSPTTVYIGRTRALVATPRDSAGGSLAGCYQVAWVSRTTVQASVNSGGVVTGRNAGLATIRATVGTLTADATVTVSPLPVATVTVSPATATLAVGATQQLTATARDSAGVAITGRPVAWSTSNAAVATVSATGMVTAKGEGSVVLTADVGGIRGTSVISVMVSPIPAGVPTTGLVRWWPLDGTGDEVIAAKHGMVDTAEPTTDRRGRSGRALGFNGTRGTVSITDPGLDPGQQQYTLQMWVRIDDPNKHLQVFANTIPHTYIGLGFNGWHAPGEAALLIGNGNGWLNEFNWTKATGASYSQGTWFQITVTKLDMVYRLYFNGQLANTVTLGPVSSTSIQLSLGSFGGDPLNEVLQGALDDVGIWNRALTAQEIIASYSTGSAMLVGR